jgi:dihydroflavonol-4-reductase
VKALVTGASGFVGSHLVERLLREGVEVVCPVRATSQLTWLEGLDAERCIADLGDINALAQAMKGMDYVFHVAGLLRAQSPEAYAAVNVEGTRHVVRAVEQAGAELRRFVYVGSLAAAGPSLTGEPLTEQDEPHPTSDYGASKLAGERVALEAGSWLPVAAVRPPAVYGPRDRSMLSLFAPAQRYHLAPIIGSPSKRLTMVHVDDLVDCVWRAAITDAARGQTYFVGSGTHTWLEVVGALEAALRRRLWRVRIPAVVAKLIGEFGELKWWLTGKPQVVGRRKVRDLLQPNWTCSWAKAGRELGYEPGVPLEEGMRQTAEWYADHGWIKPLAKRT